ncbi:MAG: diguanylate cyclase (GGDEF)-like protein/PAS domain S-box-containing protein [Desulforhopalus sp.]|jgi:diguanylate cyclase (GGDEF)-like protein/PAS domain S-box-containing protein
MKIIDNIAIDILDALPNPILVKDAKTRYIWVNRAFEELFSVKREKLHGKLDRELFPDRQAAQCNGGDLKVLSTGELDEAYEIVVDPARGNRETITRKIRQTSADGTHFLLGVMHDITEVTTLNQQLEQQAILLQKAADTDSLTGLVNRRALYPAATTLFETHGTECALLLLDLDYFKNINDNYGHIAGDAALMHFVKCARSALRDSDIFARIGGEEFAVLLSRVDQITAESIADRICSYLADTPFVFEGQSIKMTVSIGVKHHASKTKPSMDELFKLADSSLYKAKEGGRNRFVAT